ncbi:MAG: toll/interleukin-1 receptor domain-containing protein, partial [Clostridia bacterium]
INVGNSIPRKINQGLDDSIALIMLVSEEYLDSVYCTDEWEAYYLKFNKIRPNAIIPIMIGSAQPPTLIAARKYFRINENYQEYDEMLKKIKKAIIVLGKKK